VLWGIATGAGLAAAVVVPIDPGADIVSVLLAIAAANAVCLLALRRWLPTHKDQFEVGYRCGFADAAHEFAPYPPERVVTPLRRIRS
jgi:hypothetical protein